MHKHPVNWFIAKPLRFVALVSCTAVLTIGAIGLATWAIIKSTVTEAKVVTITHRVIRLERPTLAQAQAGIDKALRDLSVKQRRELLDLLLQSATTRQLHQYGLAPFRRAAPPAAAVPGAISAPQGGSPAEPAPIHHRPPPRPPQPAPAPQPSAGGSSGGGGGGPPPPRPPPPPPPVSLPPLPSPLPNACVLRLLCT